MGLPLAVAITVANKHDPIIALKFIDPIPIIRQGVGSSGKRLKKLKVIKRVIRNHLGS